MPNRIYHEYDFKMLGDGSSLTATVDYKKFDRQAFGCPWETDPSEIDVVVFDRVDQIDHVETVEFDGSDILIQFHTLLEMDREHVCRIRFYYDV